MGAGGDNAPPPVADLEDSIAPDAVQTKVGFFHSLPRHRLDGISPKLLNVHASGTPAPSRSFQPALRCGRDQGPDGPPRRLRVGGGMEGERST
jgi:hypothetical protein